MKKGCLTMEDILAAPQADDLRDLWRRKLELSPPEIGRLFTLVSLALRRYSPPELQSLPDSKEELISAFICNKLLQLDRSADCPPLARENDGHSAPSSSFAVCAYFRRYLIDCTRSAAFRRTESFENLPDDGHHELAQQDDESVDSSLRSLGLSLERVSTSASTFIQGLDAPERLLLCEGFGSDAEGGLVAVARRHHIASYHYRAGKLGLVHRRENIPKGYEKTLIGEWICKELKVSIDKENAPAILAIFEILAMVASTW
jgi:hypothetical protein